MSDEDSVKRGMDYSSKGDNSKKNKNSSTGKQEESGVTEPKLFKPGSFRKKEKSSQKDTLFVKEKKDEIIFSPSKGEKIISRENPSANENNEEQRILSSGESNTSNSKEDLPNIFTPHPENETGGKNIEEVQKKTTEVDGYEDLNNSSMMKTSLPQAPTATDNKENLQEDEPKGGE